MPPLAVDMMQVGESTGALPQMLTSVAEFYEEDVSTRMTALLSLIEPAIMIFMGIFVAFVLSGPLPAYLFSGGHNQVTHGNRNHQNPRVAGRSRRGGKPRAPLLLRIRRPPENQNRS